MAEANGTRIVDTLSLLEYRSFEILNVRPRIYSEFNKFHYFVNNTDNISLEKYAFLFIHSIYLLYTKWQIDIIRNTITLKPLIYVLTVFYILKFLHA